MTSPVALVDQRLDHELELAATIGTAAATWPRRRHGVIFGCTIWNDM